MQKSVSGIIFLALAFFFSNAFASEPGVVVIHHKDGKVEKLTSEEWSAKQQIICQQVLDKVYKELTINNLEKSYDRVTRKLLLAYLTLYRNAQDGDFNKNAVLVYLNRSLKNFDPEFEKMIKNHSIANDFEDFFPYFDQIPTKSNFYEVVKEWSNYQRTHPEMFKGLEQEYRLDQWDLTSSRLLDNIDQLGENNSRLKNLSKKFQKPKLIAENKKFMDPVNLRQKVTQTQTEIMNTINRIYLDQTSKFADYCDKDALNLYLTTNQCSINFDHTRPQVEVAWHMAQIALAVEQKDLRQISDPKTPKTVNNFGALSVVEHDYPVNTEATYCMRPEELIDTILIHHTATPETHSAMAVNNEHMGRSSNGDQWYMIGYNYLINGPYNNDKNSTQSLIVNRGRPELMIGAHAGGPAPKISDEMRELMKNSSIQCGKQGEDLADVPLKDKFDSNGRINANYNSIGISVAGNYAPVKYQKVGGVTIVKNESGYKGTTPRYPSKSVLLKVAQLMCDIQKRHPKVKTFKPHRWVTGTECPGNIINKFADIKKYAKELGCEFTY